MTKIPTAEDIKQTCNTIAMKLMEGEASQIECKLALLNGILEQIKPRVDIRIRVRHH